MRALLLRSTAAMCNLYELDATPPRLARRFGLARIASEVRERAAPGLVRPSDRAPVVHLDEDGARACSLMEWGFVREWTSPGGKAELNRLFNARSETIDSKPSFALAYRRTRAIIPASAWYELPAKGVRARLARGDGELLALAGLWERAFHPRTGVEIAAFTMAMTEGNAFTSAYHDRMPCLLDDAAIEAWLDRARPAGMQLLTPHPRDDLVAEIQATKGAAGADARSSVPRTGELF